jgi:hypothetical protein
VRTHGIHATLKPPSRLVRGMDPDFIRRVCDIFGVSAEEVIGGIGEVTADIDPVKLTELVVLSRERLGNLPEEEAGELIRVLISASRKSRQ